MCMIDLEQKRCAEGNYWLDRDFFKKPEGCGFRPQSSRILYLSSEDTHHWTAHDHMSCCRLTFRSVGPTAWCRRAPRTGEGRELWGFESVKSDTQERDWNVERIEFKIG